MKVRAAAVIAGCLLTLLVVSRRPENLATPQFYAEDGGLFFQEAYNDGFLPTLVRPTAGYLNTMPRLMAGLALLVPLAQAPLAVALLALLVQMLPVFYLLSARAAALVPSSAGRLAAALIYVALPCSDEVYVCATNTQWHLNLAGALMLLLPPPGGRVARGAELALAAIFAFTGPGGLLLLPVALLELRRRRGMDGGRHRAALAGILAAGALVQALLIVTSPRVAGAAIPGVWTLAPGEVATLLSIHAFFEPLLGGYRLDRLYVSLGPVHHAFGLFALVLVAWAALSRRDRPLAVLGYLALATVSLSLLFPSNDLRHWLNPWFGSRYYFYVSLFLAFAAARLVAAQGRLRLLGAAVALPMLALAVPSDFFLPTPEDTRYRDQLAQFETLPPGASLFIETLPDSWGMTLVRKPGTVPGPSPLAGIPLRTATVQGSLDPVRVIEGKDTIFVSGEALDPVSGAKAGGVYIMIDGRLFPAAYGRAWTIRTKDLANPAETAYQRYIPVGEVGHGTHQLAVLVLAHDRSAYFLLKTTISFTI